MIKNAVRKTNECRILYKQVFKNTMLVVLTDKCLNLKVITKFKVKKPCVFYFISFTFPSAKKKKHLKN